MKKLFANPIIIAVFFFAILCLLSLNRHSRSGVKNYHSEIYADKAGYYIYLPAYFIYHFDAKVLPKHIDVELGQGFYTDSTNNKIFTKYTYGVALMQLPFFAVGHALAPLMGFKPDGFSLIYNKTIDFAGSFYTILGFLFLYYFLIHFVSKRAAFITLWIIFLGTNAFHYAIFENGMSHIYSFCLFSMLLYLVIRKNNQRINYLNTFLVGLVIGLILMVRPINGIVLPICFLFTKVEWNNLKRYLKPLAIILLTLAIVAIPQMIYWYYLEHSLIMYSYKNESFSNLYAPKLLHLWFSTKNGLFIFNPILFIIAFSIWQLRKIKIAWSSFYAVYFLFISYVFASWWCWFYGCSFGSRPFVEYQAIFALPLSYFIQTKLVKTNWLFWLIIISCILWNMKLVFSFDNCWFGGVWDWKSFATLMMSETK